MTEADLKQKVGRKWYCKCTLQGDSVGVRVHVKVGGIRKLSAMTPSVFATAVK